MLILLRTQVDRTDKTPVTPVAPVSAVCAAFAEQPSAYPQRNAKPHVAPTCGSIGKTSGCNRTAGREDRFTAGVALAPLSAKSSDFGRCGGKAGQSCGVVRAPWQSHLPAVRAVSEICEGVPNTAKNSPRALRNEKSPPFQGKQRGSNEKHEVNTEKW